MWKGVGTGEDSALFLPYIEMHFEKFEKLGNTENPWLYRIVRHSRISNACQVANLTLEVLLKFTKS